MCPDLSLGGYETSENKERWFRRFVIVGDLQGLV